MTSTQDDRIDYPTRRLRPATSSRGYLTVGLRAGGISKTRMVHHLILEAFAGQRPLGMETRHLNGDKKDNRVANLAWGTPAENGADRVRHGTVPRGEDGTNAKLDNAAVLAIRSAYRRGSVTQRELADLYGVCRENVSAIVRRRSWTHI